MRPARNWLPLLDERLAKTVAPVSVLRSLPAIEDRHDNSRQNSPPHGSKNIVLSCFTALAITCLAAPGQAFEDYEIGPQDTLRIRVYEWRPTTATTYEWVPLTSEFTVSPAGNLSLPIIGIVPAAGNSLEELADTISARLQRQVGLQKPPNASVEVASYRPIFVAGMVTNPGKYNFNPGLTVLQALSMAGGAGLMDANMIGLQKDALVSRGDLRSLEDERLGLLARQARIGAILNMATLVDFPKELNDRLGEPQVQRIIVEERSLFEAGGRMLQAEIEALDRAKLLALNQIEALKAKSQSLTKQIELATNDLSAVNKLVSQGLTVSARQLGASQNVAELESRSLDVSLALFRTQQDLARLDQDIANVRNRSRVDALTESAELRDRLATNTQKIQTVQSLLRNLETRAPSAMASLTEANEASAYRLSVDRVVNGASTSVVVNENDPLLPGDVLRVDRIETSSWLPPHDLGAEN